MFSVIFGITFAASLLVISLLAGKRLTARRAPDQPDNPGNYGIRYENVTFPSRYKATLNGWWLPAEQERSKGSVVFCHGQNGSMDGDIRQAVQIHQAGYNILMFNFRAHGTSGGSTVTFGVFEKEDLLGALDYLQAEKGIDQVAVMGFSMGAGVATIGAALDDRISTLVLDGAFLRFVDTLETWIRTHHVPAGISWLLAQLVLLGASLVTNTRMYQISPILWAKHVESTPILFIHGEKDRLIALSDVKTLASDLNGEYHIWVAPGCDHREAFIKHQAEYGRQVTAWLENHL